MECEELVVCPGTLLLEGVNFVGQSSGQTKSISLLYCKCCSFIKARICEDFVAPESHTEYLVVVHDVFRRTRDRASYGKIRDLESVFEPKEFSTFDQTLYESHVSVSQSYSPNIQTHVKMSIDKHIRRGHPSEC
jgi:hypothetical protein